MRKGYNTKKIKPKTHKNSLIYNTYKFLLYDIFGKLNSHLIKIQLIWLDQESFSITFYTPSSPLHPYSLHQPLQPTPRKVFGQMWKG